MAEWGLQIWTESGVPVLDLSDRIVKILGKRSTGTSNSSFRVPEGNRGRVFFFLTAQFAGGGRSWFWPRFSVSGDQISWEFADDAPERASVEFFYGIY